MAVIPTYQPRAGLDVGGGVNLPPLDQTLARAVEGLGVSVEQVGLHLQQQQQQKSVFSAEQSYLQFQNKVQQTYAEHQAQMPVAGEGWHDAWTPTVPGTTGEYDKAANAFLATIPQNLRPQYTERVATLRSDWSGKAAVDQLNERNKWFRSSLKDAAAGLELDIRRNGSANFDQFRASGDTLILNSPLSPAEKQTLLKDWHANAAIARVQSLADTDPQAAADELHAWLSQQPTAGGGAAHGLQQPVADAIDAAAASAGIPAATMRAYALIESSGNPNAGAGGKYQGLFQLGADEFAKGGGGNILNATDNARAAAVNLKAHIEAFQKQFGRAPAPFELYLMHQQGEAGAFAHIANPGGAAWQNVRKFYGSDQVAKEAIWGNIPDDVKQRFPGGVDSVTSADFMSLWANKVERFGGGTSYLADLTPDQIDKLSGAVQQQVNQQRVEDARIASDGRADIVKYGEDLIHNGSDPSKPQLTADWVQANRENLSPSDYKYFRTALDKDETTIKTPPHELLRLDDMVQADPKGALKELRTEFANHQITRGTYDQLVGRAQGIINGEEKRPFVGQVRSYLAQIIRPDADGSLNEYSKAFQTLAVFDEWAGKNKEAGQADVQGFADKLVRNQRLYVALYRRENLPIPRFANVPNRWLISDEILDAATVSLANAKLAHSVGEQEAADQTRLITDWRDVVHRTSLLPPGYVPR